LAEETNENIETEEVEYEEVEAPTPQPLNLDQTIQVGGEEYTLSELAEAKQQLAMMESYTSGLESFREATTRLMNPETDPEVKKRDARQILLDLNYSPEHVEEWVKVYDEGTDMAQPEQTPIPTTDPRTDELNQQVMKMRAQMLQQNLESSISSSIDGDADGKVLMEWVSKTKQGEDLESVKKSIAERVRSQALENLRQRRNYAGSFEDAWVGEEVKKAASKVAKDMLTVIGDTSKIGRVPETAGQTETLSRKDPVKLPKTEGKSFGDVEGQLRSWTTDQILRSLSDPGGDSKA
jgi:hypothetical protein